MIGQFSGPYFSVRPARPSRALDFKIKTCNKYLTKLVFSSIYGPSAKRLGHKLKRKNAGCNLQYGPRTRLVRGIFSIYGNIQREFRNIEEFRNSQKKRVFLGVKTCDFFLCFLPLLSCTIFHSMLQCRLF